MPVCRGTRSVSLLRSGHLTPTVRFVPLLSVFSVKLLLYSHPYTTRVVILLSLCLGPAAHFPHPILHRAQATLNGAKSPLGHAHDFPCHHYLVPCPVQKRSDMVQLPQIWSHGLDAGSLRRWPCRVASRLPFHTSIRPIFSLIDAPSPVAVTS